MGRRYSGIFLQQLHHEFPGFRGSRPLCGMHLEEEM